MKKVFLGVLLVAALFSLSGCSVLELLFTGTTQGIEENRAAAAWAQSTAADNQRQAEQAAADKAEALARLEDAKNQGAAQAYAFALAEAEITSRLHESNSFYLAFSQQQILHDERVRDLAQPNQPKQLRPWVPVAAGTVGMLLGAAILGFILLKLRGGIDG